MPEIREVTSMCKNGKVSEAYTLARADLEDMPNYPWVQREVGWVLYYMIKNDMENGDASALLCHLDELKALNLLTMDSDSMIFDNVQFKVAEYIRKHLLVNDAGSMQLLSALFSKIKDYKFQASKAHSLLLQSCLKYEAWSEFPDFIDWWNLDNLTQDDYTPYVNGNGQKMMTTAERVHIAYAKSLLRSQDTERITSFLLRLETLINDHPEMMYPGYFYGKLLLATGSNVEEALKAVIPFARKKVSEFWVWQLLSEVYFQKPEKQIACLLRAVHCRTQETFLGKVRIKLASLYIQRNEYARAKYHIDAVVRCYVSQGWRLPYEIECWSHQQWINEISADATESVDYKRITDDILCEGTDECVAVVSYVDPNTHKSFLIYGMKQKMCAKLKIRVNTGDVLKLRYTKDVDGRIQVMKADSLVLPDHLPFAKNVDCEVERKPDKDFAFVKYRDKRAFVSPNLVSRCSLQDGDKCKCVVVYDHDKKKDVWNWVCVKVKKQGL